jgi:hypothetical protein
MTTTPIYDALDLAADALKTALVPLVPLFQNAAAVYWLQNPPESVGALRTGALASLIICQSQDLGGRRRDHISRSGWSGLVVVRALSASEATAKTVQQGVAARMALLAVPAGYQIGARFDRPIALPPKDGIHTRASQWRVTIARA